MNAPNRRRGVTSARLMMVSTAAAAWLAPLAAHAVHFAVPRDIDQLIEPGTPLGNTPNELIAAGYRVFTEETFEGNGRTCASCHIALENFTNSPAIIATLPDDDPFFVNEFDPRLTDLENDTLLREYALNLENHDGFDEPPTFRSVPHTFGLSQTVTPDKGDATRPGFSLDGATGWSGDGTPEDGSLRFFPLGAIEQHFTKSLNRIACSPSNFDDPATAVGCDFRVPTDAELNAVLALMNFLGRQGEIDLASMNFADARVESGKALFFNTPTTDPDTQRACNDCHTNAGSNDADGNNRQFATGTNFSPNAPACREPGVVGDGGFGPFNENKATIDCADGSSVEVEFRGDNFFNVATIIEAADTPPFFSANIADTIEDAVKFYTSEAAKNSITFDGIAFDLNTTQINYIGALLRTLNSLDNLEQGNRYLDFALEIESYDAEVALAFLAIAESQTQDTIEVLTDGPLLLFPGVSAGGTSLLTRIRQARDLQQEALRQGTPLNANLLGRAQTAQNQAINAILVD